MKRSPDQQPDLSALDDAMNPLQRMLIDAGLDPAAGFQVVPAGAIAGRHHPGVEVSLPLFITGLADVSPVALAAVLLNAYPEDHALHVVGTETGSAGGSLHLHDLAAVDWASAPAMLLLPPLAPGASFTQLQEIVAHLRAPDGCPWDREQTLASLRQDLLSETVEVLEAIDLEATGVDNSHHIAEELGDAMMLATLMTQIAIDEGRFRMGDVMRQIVEKLIRRHPHVFGDVEVGGNDDIIANWEAIKAEEKASKGIVHAGPLDGVPAELPALEKARRVQSKASKAGLLDRRTLAASLPALADLLDHMAGESSGEETLGELLWVLVAAARERGINAEDALRSYAVAYRHAAGDAEAQARADSGRK